MKLFKLILFSLALTLIIDIGSMKTIALANPSSEIDSAESSTEETRLLEDAYQRLLQINQVESHQKKYIDGGVQMEMFYSGNLKNN